MLEQRLQVCVDLPRILLDIDNVINEVLELSQILTREQAVGLTEKSVELLFVVLLVSRNERKLLDVSGVGHDLADFFRVRDFPVDRSPRDHVQASREELSVRENLKNIVPFSR